MGISSSAFVAKVSPFKSEVSTLKLQHLLASPALKDVIVPIFAPQVQTRKMGRLCA